MKATEVRGVGCQAIP